MQEARELVVPGVRELGTEAGELSRKLKSTVQDLMFCIRHTRPTKQFLAELVLATVSLEMTLIQLTKAGSIEHRKTLETEFRKGTAIVQKGIKALWDRAKINPEKVAVRAEALVIVTKQKAAEGLIRDLNLLDQAEEV